MIKMQSSPIEIQESDFERLDWGGFGTVYRIKNSQPPTVLKDIHDKHADPQGIRDKECTALQDLKHDHIVKYYGIGSFCPNAKNVIRFGILMEYCEKGSLKDWLYEPTLLYEMSTVVWWSQQMMSALEYLHEKKTVHRDIKPANILVTEHFVLKLGDFGSTRLNHHTTSDFSSVALTQRYMSPELWTNTSFESNRVISSRSDVYSLGLVMWEMIERRWVPITVSQTIIKFRRIFSDSKVATDYSINAGDKPFFEFEPLICVHKMRNIIEKCTVFDYKARPHASEIRQEISEICERIEEAAALPRINNNQIRVLKPMELETITCLPSPLEVQPLQSIHSLQDCPSDSGPLHIHPTLPQIDESRVRILRKHLDTVRICSWSPKEDVLATGSSDNTARIWDLQDCEDMNNPDSKYENGFVFKHSSWNGYVSALDWHQTGDKIATGGYAGVVRIWDTTSGELHSTLEGHKGSIGALRWTPSGDLLLSGSWDNSTIVWEQPTKTRSTKYQKKQQFDFHSGYVSDVDWISDDTFASCSLDKTFKVCRVGSDRPIRTYTGHTDWVRAVRYDPFSKRLASCSDDASIKIWSLSEDEPVHTFKQHLGSVNTVRWSPLGSILASASYDTTVRVWDGNEGKEVAVLDGHTGSVDSLAFSPNGQFIASGSWDGSVLVWDVKTGQPVTSWKGNNGEGGIQDVAFNRTGEKLAACTDKGAVIIMGIRFLKRGHDDSILPMHRMDLST